MKKRKTVIALALFLGVFGAHRFYLRQKFKALLCLLFCWSLIPAFFGLCDAIFFFFMNDDDFNYRYNTGIDTEHKYCAGCGVKFSLLNMPAFSVNLATVINYVLTAIIKFLLPINNSDFILLNCTILKMLRIF